MEEGELTGDEGELLNHLNIEEGRSSALTSPVTIGSSRGNQLARKKWRGCVPLDDFRMEEKVGEGTFGVVHKAVHRQTGRQVALKKILTRPEQEGFPITALREIKQLKLVKHANTMSLTDMAVSTDGVYMVFDFMDHDLTGLLESPEVKLSIPAIKLYMKQLLTGLQYLHSVGILHRDVKGANLLINNSGELRIADFGLARQQEEGRVHYTPGVVTRWYRPPELLLGATRYGPAVDMWGAGCILGEMLLKQPLLPGESDLHQLELIVKLCGPLDESAMPGCSALPDFAKVRLPTGYKRKIRDAFGTKDHMAADLVEHLLVLDPAKRLTATQALQHEFFKTPPLAALPSDLPSYSSKHEYTCHAENERGGRRRHHEFHDAPHPTPHQHGRDSFEQSPELDPRPNAKANGNNVPPPPPPPPPPPKPGDRYRGAAAPTNRKSSRSPGKKESTRSPSKIKSPGRKSPPRNRSPGRRSPVPANPSASSSSRDRIDREHHRTSLDRPPRSPSLDIRTPRSPSRDCRRYHDDPRRSHHPRAHHEYPHHGHPYFEPPPYYEHPPPYDPYYDYPPQGHYDAYYEHQAYPYQPEYHSQRRSSRDYRRDVHRHGQVNRQEAPRRDHDSPIQSRVRPFEPSSRPHLSNGKRPIQALGTTDSSIDYDFEEPSARRREKEPWGKSSGPSRDKDRKDEKRAVDSSDGGQPKAIPIFTSEPGEIHE